jgi:photosystem II stability/assembly factor-like uncharacterized protein
MIKLLKIAFLAFFIPVLAFSAWELTEGSSGEIKSITSAGGKLYAASYGNGAFFSQTKGVTWIPINSGMETNLVWDIKELSNRIFAATEGKGIYMSTNSGLNWSKSNDGLGHFSVFALSTSNNNIYAMTDETGLFYSTDLGKNWATMNNGDINLILASIASRNNEVYVGSEFGNLYKTTNFGQNWENLKSGPLISTIKSILLEDEKIFLGTSSGVYLSVDGGKNWTSASQGLTNFDINSIIKIGEKLIAATNGGGIFFSNTDGKIWIEINEEIPDYKILSLAFDDEYVYAGTSNSGIIRRKISDIKFPELKAPQLLTPENKQTNQEFEIVLRWSNVPAAASYHVQIALDANFNNIFREKDQLQNTFYNVSGLSEDTDYYWRVASNSLDNQKIWSEVWSFKTKVILQASNLIFPEDQSSVAIPVSFLWNKAKGALSYKIQVALDESFEELVINSAAIPDTFYKATNLSENVNYFWKVISIGPGESTQESVIRKFKSLPTGVEDTSIYQAFSIFPNPAKNSVNIEIGDINSENITLEIYNLLGEKLIQQELICNQKTHLINFELPPGFYSVRLISVKNSYFRRLIVN